MIADMLSLTFIRYALAAGTLVSLTAALLGVPLVLKRYSMIGDGLSHVGFGALAVAMALHAAPLAVAIPLVLLAAFLLLRLSENSRLKGDAAIALVSSSALAVGVLVLAFTKGSTGDVYNYLFGSILAVGRADFWLSMGFCAAVLAVYALCYHKIYAITFDETFARASGVRAGAWNALLALLTALVIVLGLRLMGAMLISSLIVFPALTAMRVCRSYRGVVVTAAALSVVCFVAGLVLSYALETPSGATVVTVNLAAFLAFSVVGAVRKRRG
ncbi:MAG: metal ABC transporter permease [Clostridiales bacterium]|nr:metal ABC transporter permease [Clostridiales bacterium]